MASWLFLLWTGLAVAQDEPNEAPVDQIVDELTQGPDVAPVAAAKNPWEAFKNGDFAGALQGFIERQVERPHDAEALMNVGAAQYKVGDFEAATATFSRAAALSNDTLRAEALYNLGNTAYRAGKLEEAVKHYQAALAINADDADSKFNLEFVRDEIRRRHEEAQDREEQQDQQQQDQPDQDQEGQDQEGQDQEGQDQEQQEQDQQEQGQQDQDQQGQQDSDGDGLSDRTETQGDNPTDPTNPDSDGDGQPDGKEDANQNGRVDEGETDPNQPDSPESGQANADAGEPQPMTEEEAQRYLQSLEEGRPDPQKPPTGTPTAAPGGKDW